MAMVLQITQLILPMEMIPREPTVPEPEVKTETKKQEFRRRVREMMRNKTCAQHYQNIMVASYSDLRGVRNALSSSGHVGVAETVDNIIKTKIAINNQK